MRDLLFLGVMAVLVPLALRFPMIGVMGWAWSALLTPHDWLYTYMTGIPYNKVFAAAVFVSMALGVRQLHFRMNTALWLILCLFVVATCSAVFSIDQSDAGWVLYWRLVKILIFPFIITAAVRTRLDMHALLLAVALGMGFVGLSQGAFWLVSGGHHRIVGNSAVGDNNQLAVWLLMVLPVVRYLAAQAELRAMRVIGYVAAGLILAAIVGTYSRGALVGLVALALFMVAGGRRKLAGIALVAVIGVIVVLVAPESWYHRMDTISDASQDSSFMGRVVAWKISTAIGLARPIFGGGFHAVQHMFAWQYYAGQIGWMDFIPTPTPDVFPHAAHSIYFETFGDLGFTGLALFLSLMLLVYRNARAARRMAANRVELQWAADMGQMIQASLVAFMVAGAAVSVSYIDMFYILVALSSLLRAHVAAAIRAPAATGVALRPAPGRALAPAARPAWREHGAGGG